MWRRAFVWGIGNERREVAGTANERSAFSIFVPGIAGVVRKTKRAILILDNVARLYRTLQVGADRLSADHER
jgi:hypothetical protein